MPCRSFARKTAQNRYRIPEVCVLLSVPGSDYLAEAAFLVVEVLSKDDKMPDVLEKLAEYCQKGVPNIWLMNPRRQTMYVYEDGDLSLVRGDVICTEDRMIELHRTEIFKD
jgi:Uma2 family endonuclease